VDEASTDGARTRITRRQVASWWFLVHGIGAAGCAVLLVGGFRLQSCAPRNPLLAGNSGPFRYGRAEEYVYSSLFLTGAYLFCAITLFAVVKTEDREGPLKIWSSANVGSAFVLAVLNFFNAFAQDDSAQLCGARMVSFLLILVFPFVLALAANVALFRRQPKGFPT